MSALNKKKIINDPVHGFISIPCDLIYDLLQHPLFQRLRRIKQLGLTSLVYPGAMHTRFAHALGAMHLTTLAINTLRSKGVLISDEEAEATQAAILLHDIGHGPFSHALENTIVNGVHHEEISLLFMQQINRELGGQLDMAIRIFKDEYPRQFLHQLVSSQLDMDRMDYLLRDSFYTGVTEGQIGSERILKMLYVVDDELVVEDKGIYSIEKFIIARRLMYWQVYLHKTVIAAECMLIKILERAKKLASVGEELFSTPALRHFLYTPDLKQEFFNNPLHQQRFAQLDDDDIHTAIKVWSQHQDSILRELCSAMNARQLPRILIQNEPFNPAFIQKALDETAKTLHISSEEAESFVFSDSVSNNAYNPEGIKINIWSKGRLIDIAEATDQYNITALSKPVKKYYLIHPKAITLS